MKTVRAKLIVPVLVVLLAGFTAYSYRVYIAAWAWHVRHGTSTTLGHYVVPVPRNWYLLDEGDGALQLVRLDTDDRSPRKRIKGAAAILVSISGVTTTEQNVKSVLSRQKELMEENGTGSILERTLDIDGETLFCLGGIPLNIGGDFDLDLVGWHCSSPGGVQVTIEATEPDLDQAWSIVSRIRKQS